MLPCGARRLLGHSVSRLGARAPPFCSSLSPLKATSRASAGTTSFLSDKRGSELGLHPLLTRNLRAGLGLEHAAVIQTAALPVIGRGGDVIIAAETGSGKSLAFCVPMLDRLLRCTPTLPQQQDQGGDRGGQQSQPPLRPTAILLLPTSDLCRQLLGVLESLCAGTGVVPLIGTDALRPWAEAPEEAGHLDAFIKHAHLEDAPAEGEASPALRPPEVGSGATSAADAAERAAVVMCTPGMFRGWSDEHLVRLARTPGLLHTVCLDEVDMLLTGDERFVRRFVRMSRPPKQRNARRRSRGDADRSSLEETTGKWQPQLIVTGATMPDSGTRSMWSVLQQLLPDAALVRSDLALHRHNPLLAQNFVSIPSSADRGSGHGGGSALCEGRVGMLLRLLRSEEHVESDVRTMVFCNTVGSAEALCARLGRECAAGALPHMVLPFHKKVKPAARWQNLLAFGAAEVPALLVCTDLASRGMDVPLVHHVVQFEFASNVVAHLHRIGRTARAGQAGKVTNFVDAGAAELVESIQSAGAETLATSFSRRRGFRKRVRKKQKQQHPKAKAHRHRDNQPHEEEEEEW